MDLLYDKEKDLYYTRKDAIQRLFGFFKLTDYTVKEDLRLEVKLSFSSEQESMSKGLQNELRQLGKTVSWSANKNKTVITWPPED